jgi:hypothetical protein
VAFAGIAIGLVLFFAAISPADGPTLTLGATDATVGSAIHATAHLAESPGAEGEITFEVFGPGDATCSGPALTPAPAPATVNGEGDYGTEFTPSGAGTYHWSAHYTGDLVNPSADATCAAASVVAKASPGISGSASNATVGATIKDEATISGGFSPSGEITFKVFGPGDATCATPLATKTAAIASGKATSPTFTPSQAGQFRWTASYPGDANNQAAETACGAANQTSTVAKASPTLSGTATASAVVGATIKDEVTVNEGFSASGEVTFKVFGPGDTGCITPLATKTAAIVSGHATSPNFTTSQAGQFRWTATYPGDGNNQAAETACGAANQTSTVAKATPTLSGTASNAAVGSTIHDEVTVNEGFSASGEVTFKVFGPGDTGCTAPLATKTASIVSGHATSPNFTTPQAGQFRWTATYPGDTNNQAAETTCGAANQTSAVSKAAPTLSGTASNATVGSTIHDEVTFSGAFSPSGEITFKVFGPGDATCSNTPLATKTASIVSGHATSPNFTTPQAGQFRWTASYPGDANNEAAETTCGAANQASTVSKAAPTLSGTASNATVGSTIKDEVTVNGGFSPSGEVTFKVFGPGDTGCITPLATKTAAIVSGHATSPNFTTPQAGQFRWTATYPGDGNNQAAETACGAVNQTSTVAKATPGLTVLASDAAVNNAIHDEVTLTGFSPSGEVTFKVFGPGDNTCATPLATKTAAIVSGHAISPSFIPQTVGAYRWTASYPGDGNNEAVETSCGAVNQTSTVSKASPALSGTATASVVVGSTIKDEATISGGFSPSGEITFKVFGPGDTGCSTPLATKTAPIVSGHATSPTFTTPHAGEYRWTASYPGDANNQAVDTTCGAVNQTSTVAKASPALSGTATLNAVVGSTIKDEATLSAGFSPSGEITFKVFGPGDTGCSTPLATKTAPIVSGHATSPDFSPQATGAFRWKASYPGDGDNEAAETGCGSGNQVSTVSKAAPSLAGTASNATVGATLKDEVTVNGGFSPSGEVSFEVFGPGDTACTTPLTTPKTAPIASGHATSPDFTAPHAGQYRWIASYPGDANNEATETACGAANQTSTVTKASPVLSGTAESTVTVGSTITDNVTLSGGFSAGGQLLFRAYGPGEGSCGPVPLYEKTVAVNGDGNYAPAGFAPPAGLYAWTVEYSGDGDNNARNLPCGSSNQSSAVGVLNVTLSTSAGSGTVGIPLTATATIEKGAIPSGQLTFAAFPPEDTTCAGAPAFSSSVAVAGNGSYNSAAFTPTRVGAFRWTVAYSGDPHHAATKTSCGAATSAVLQAAPSISGGVKGRAKVGVPFKMAAVLSGGFAPGGTISFRLYGPSGTSCAKPFAIDTVGVSGNGTVLSDPFTAPRTGRYSFVAIYSGDAANQSASQACDQAGQTVQVEKSTPKLKPSARLKTRRRISIAARLSGATSPSGSIGFDLYRPGDTGCSRKPVFDGAVTVKANGPHPLAEYLATRHGLYRLVVSYSGDPRNRPVKGECHNAQKIRAG